jgi:hypothetical protein
LQQTCAERNFWRFVERKRSAVSKKTPAKSVGHAIRNAPLLPNTAITSITAATQAPHEAVPRGRADRSRVVEKRGRCVIARNIATVY